MPPATSAQLEMYVAVQWGEPDGGTNIIGRAWLRTVEPSHLFDEIPDLKAPITSLIAQFMEHHGIRDKVKSVSLEDFERVYLERMNEKEESGGNLNSWCIAQLANGVYVARYNTTSWLDCIPILWLAPPGWKPSKADCKYD